ncbi:MAG: hypothetical protein ACI9F9_000796 [Candidatus Paceibacteria bacterium]|jgi:hypothetical protein
MKLPYSMEAWFPLMGGALQGVRVLGQNGPASVEEVHNAWNECRNGEALVILDSIQGGLRSGLRERCGRLSMLRKVSDKLVTEGCVYRWRVLPGTGGSHVLLPAQRGGLNAGKEFLPAGRRRWRIARSILGVLDQVGLGDRTGFSEVLVAIKGPAGSPLCPWIAQCTDSMIAIALGVPGLLRKATMMVHDASREVRGFVKVSLGEPARARIQHEASTLDRIERTKLPSGIAPRLLASGETEHCAWMAQSPLRGQRSADQVAMPHINYLAQLAKGTGHQRAFDELPSFRRSEVLLAQLARTVDAEWIEGMGTLAEGLRLALSGSELQCALSHGDFTPWNIIHEDQRLAVFDWEFAAWDAPALADLVHFHLQTGILVRRVSADLLLEELVSLVAGEARCLIPGMSQETTGSLAYIGLEVLRAASTDEAQNAIQCPDFEQVGWLRAARLELAWSIGERLQAEHSHRKRGALAA